MSADMPHELGVTLKSLKRNRFDARFARTAAEACEMVLEMIPPSAVVGAGDSATLRQVGVLEELVKRGNPVVNPFTVEMTRDMGVNPVTYARFMVAARHTFASDVFLSGANAVTGDGKLVSIDRAGNRVAATIFGAPRVILILGRNKIVKDAEAAVDRIKNVIAPEHAKRKGRKTPCAVTGRCADCDSPDRICNITVIMEKKPSLTDLSVILVNEDLGLGWDPGWDEQRISEIRSNYYQNTWVFFLPKEKKQAIRNRSSG